MILFVQEAGNTRELFSFEKFQRSSATRGDVGYSVCKTEFFNSGSAVSSADNCNRTGIGQSLRHGFGTVCKSVELKNAHRTVPDDRACAFDCGSKLFNSLRAYIHAHKIIGNIAFNQNGFGIS